MKLYYMPGACSMASHITAREAGLDVQIVKVSFNQDGTRITELGENYYEINSMGYVPAFQLENGEYLTEGPAILQYIADQVPAKELMPVAGSIERYRLIEWLTFVSSEVHKTFSGLFRPNLPESEKEFIISKLEKRFEHLNNRLSDRAFIMGEKFTIVDAYLFTVVNWKGKFGIEIAKYAHLSKYIEAVAARPAVVQTMKAEGLL